MNLLGLVGECGDEVFDARADGYHDVLADVVLFCFVEFRDRERAFVAASRVEFGDVTDLNVVLVFELCNELAVHLSFSVCLVNQLNQKKMGMNLPVRIAMWFGMDLFRPTSGGTPVVLRHEEEFSPFVDGLFAPIVRLPDTHGWREFPCCDHAFEAA